MQRINKKPSSINPMSLIEPEIVKRNIELRSDIDHLREKIKAKDRAYKKLWNEHQEATQKLAMINEFTQDLTKVYPCGK